MNDLLRYVRRAAMGAAAVVLLSGCFENDFLTPYDGEPVLGFAQVNGSYTPTINITPPPGTATVPTTPIPLTIPVTVELIGPQPSSDIVVTVVRDDAATTAVPGTDYTAPDLTQLVIPANSSTATFNVVLTRRLVRDETRTVTYKLAGSADGSIAAAPNFDDLAITFRGR